MIKRHKITAVSLTKGLSVQMSDWTLTVVAGPVQRRVPAVVPQGGQGRRLRAGDAQQLAEPGGVASSRRQVDGGTTSRVAEQNRGLLLQETLDTLLLTTQQLHTMKR